MVQKYSGLMIYLGFTSSAARWAAFGRMKMFGDESMATIDSTCLDVWAQVLPGSVEC
jgi:hypothetical protein